MTHSRHLEAAQIYCDRLTGLTRFRKMLSEWNGKVNCSVGGYSTDLSMGCTRDAFVAALDVEERMIRNTLEIWGVEYEEPTP